MFPSVPRRRRRPPAGQRANKASLQRRLDALMAGDDVKPLTGAEKRRMRGEARREPTEDEEREMYERLARLPAVPAKKAQRRRSSSAGPRDLRLTKACSLAFKKMARAHETLASAAAAYNRADKQFDAWMRTESRGFRECLDSPSGEGAADDDDLAARFAALNVGVERKGSLLSAACAASISLVAEKQREVRRLQAAYKKADNAFNASVTKALREAKKCNL
jgi:hypothetical protein